MGAVELLPPPPLLVGTPDALDCDTRTEEDNDDDDEDDGGGGVVNDLPPDRRDELRAVAAAMMEVGEEGEPDSGCG